MQNKILEDECVRIAFVRHIQTIVYILMLHNSLIRVCYVCKSFLWIVWIEAFNVEFLEKVWGDLIWDLTFILWLRIKEIFLQKW